MQHVTYLRMHGAAERSMTTNESVAQIAEQVGYANPFAFSDAFKRWIGCVLFNIVIPEQWSKLQLSRRGIARRMILWLNLIRTMHVDAVTGMFAIASAPRTTKQLDQRNTDDETFSFATDLHVPLRQCDAGDRVMLCRGANR